MPTPLPTDLHALLIAQTVDAVIFADVAGYIRLWNLAATTVFGFSADEAMGRSLDLIIPERLREAHWRGYHAAMASGTTRLAGRPALTRGVHSSGRRLYVEMTFSVVVDAASAVIGSVAVARDVTEKQLAARSGAT